MPRKTKESEVLENKKEKVAKTSTTKGKTKKDEKNLIIDEKKSKKESSKPKASTKNTKSTKTKVADSKTTKKSNTKKATTKKTSASKKAGSSTRTRKTVSKTATKKATKKEKIDIVEYYDLPYRYNQTVVKVLAQTPSNLFIYWDISDKDRENYKKQYGDNFFETTKPVLIIHNDTLNYSFEVDINDFANSWYLHVNDSKCNYRVELGRRPINYSNKQINTDYIYVSMSNEIESPNDRVLLKSEPKTIYFKNVKTGVQTSKYISNFSFMKNMGEAYNVLDFYKEFYKNDVKNDSGDIFNIQNPSSSNPTSRV